jgi:DNA modification methylase
MSLTPTSLDVQSDVRGVTEASTNGNGNVNERELGRRMVYVNALGSLYCGDAKSTLQLLPDGCVDCIIGSPPYFAVRDYGVAGQIGLESTLDAYIQALVDVYSAAWRVLKPEGSCWVVIGDTYIAKSLQMVPARFALAMAAQGWLVRNDIIWRKTRSMPHPVKDRLVATHEHIFHFVKQGQYYYDLDAIRLPHKESSLKRVQSAINVSHKGRYGEDSGSRGRTIDGLNEMSALHVKGRNPGDVFEACPSNSANGHFATFPKQLVEPRVRSTCPPGGTVMDFWMGSGVTAKVAEELSRRWIGIELNPEYCKIIAETLRETQLSVL